MIQQQHHKTAAVSTTIRASLRRLALRTLRFKLRELFLFSASSHPLAGVVPCPRQVPFCLPERLLVQLHNDGMAERARKQVERVRSLYPDLMRSLLSHPKTAVYVTRQDQQGAAVQAPEAPEKETDTAPMALLWAFAMVRSRAFAADDDRFAFVPFLVR